MGARCSGLRANGRTVLYSRRLWLPGVRLCLLNGVLTCVDSKFAPRELKEFCMPAPVRSKTCKCIIEKPD